MDRELTCWQCGGEVPVTSWHLDPVTGEYGCRFPVRQYVTAWDRVVRSLDRAGQDRIADVICRVLWHA